MDFFNKLTQKAKETYGVASKKTGEIAKEAKLKMKMNENKAEINDLYQEIGKKVYEKHVLLGEIDIKIDLEEECTKIDVLSAEIETCLNQIRELKDKKQCPKCFNEIDLESKFCNHCGAKQDVEEACEVEVVSTNDSQEQPQESVSITQEATNSEVTTTEDNSSVGENQVDNAGAENNNDDDLNNQN